VSEVGRPGIGGRVQPRRRVLAFQVADLFLGHLPRRVSYTLMTVVGWVVATIFPGRIRGLFDNLRRAFPEYTDAQITDLMQRNAKNYGKFWVDLFKIPRLKPEYRASLATIDGLENLQGVLDRGKGCIAISIHTGGWEGSVAVWGQYPGIHAALIAEVLEPPALWRRVKALRQKTGMELIPLTRTAARDILRRLKDNQVVAAAIDRDITGTGKPYQFFGATAPIPTGVFELAQRTGAGVLPVLCLRDAGDTYRIVGMEPFWVGDEPGAVDAAVNRALRVFEESIRTYPDQWHVMEPIWDLAEKARPTAEPEQAAAAVRIYPAGGSAELPEKEAGVG
jgi:KDO2-lipid IV(A) lauroyltransferase